MRKKVRASISPRQPVDVGRDGDVLLGQVGSPARQWRVCFSLNEPNGFGGIFGDEGSHILDKCLSSQSHNSSRLVVSAKPYKLHHGANASPRLLLISRDCLAAQQSALLSSVPVELDRSVARNEAALRQDAKSFENAHRAGAVIVSAGSREQREEIVHGVLVSAENGQRQREVPHFGLKTSDDGGLGKGVSEELERDVSVERRILDDLK